MNGNNGWSPLTTWICGENSVPQKLTICSISYWKVTYIRNLDFAPSQSRNNVDFKTASGDSCIVLQLVCLCQNQSSSCKCSGFPILKLLLCHVITFTTISQSCAPMPLLSSPKLSLFGVKPTHWQSGWPPFIHFLSMGSQLSLLLRIATTSHIF